MKGLIHCHSENSRYDSPMDVNTLCKRSKELGYEAVTLTDHGTLTGIDDFVKAAKEVGIKPIPGVEAYVQEDESKYGRRHLILLAKDDIGYQGISKAVTESNKRIDSNGFPRMNKEILQKYFGVKSKYHDHVIATSACAGGILAGILLSPFEFEKKNTKLREKLKKYESPKSESYKRNCDKLKRKNDDLNDLVEKREELNTLSKKAFKKKENALAKLQKTASEEEYQEAYDALMKEKNESEEAKKELEKVRISISIIKKDITTIKGKIKESEESQAHFNEIMNEIKENANNIVPVENLYNKVLEESKFYDETFGHGNFYIEMQNHGYLINDVDKEYKSEEISMPQLLKVADELDIKIVAANDAHIPDNSENSLRARQIISSLRFAKKGFITTIQEGDKELYLKTEEELEKALSEIIPNDRAKEAIQNTYKICEECNCEFKNGEHYPKFKGLLPGETADEALRRMTLAGIEKRFPKKIGWTKEYKERMEYELQVISEMGYSDYFLIVQDFLEFGRKLGHLSNVSLQYLKSVIKTISLKDLVIFVDTHQEEVGFAVGAGRGSAAGSLVAYLVGITNIIDPLQYALLFERFLNKDRVSMPETSGIQCEPCSRVCL